MISMNVLKLQMHVVRMDSALTKMVRFHANVTLAIVLIYPAGHWWR